MKHNNNFRKRKKTKLNFDGTPSSKLKMRYYREKRKQKRIKKTITKLQLFLRLGLIFLLLWGISRLLISKLWYLPQDIFSKYPNQHIKIIGSKITPNEKILTALKTIPIENKPIYLINTVPYEDQVEKLNSVKKAFVRRYWIPARFEVIIEEEIPVITISPTPSAPEIVALTADGKIIDRSYLPINKDYCITYKILTYEDYKKWSKKEILSLKVLSQRIEDYSGEELLYLDIRNKKDVYAQLRTTKIRIGELSSTLNDRISKLPSIMPQIEELKKQIEYVDLRWDKTTYLKMKSKSD